MKEQITISNPFVIFLTFLLGLVFITSSCQQTDHETTAAQNEELAMAYIEALYNAQDRAALEELVADPQTYDGEEVSREAFLERVEGVWQAFPDMKFDLTHVVGAEGYATVRGVLTGTGGGEYRGHDIDGQEFEVTQIILFHVQEGQIAWSYAERDDLDLWEQLGVLERPYPEE